MRPPTPQILDFGGWFRILDFGDFGFWILGIGDFGFWGFWILDFGEFGFCILWPESQIPNPKSPIQTFLAKFSAFWILDFGSLCSNSLREAPTPHILDFGGDFEFWILEVGDTGFWILGILDFGFLEHYVADLYVQSLDFGIWGFWILGILDFGDFGFWILGILDFGFWTGDFGLAPCDKILDAT